MGKGFAEHKFTGPTTPYTSYDSTKTNLGALIRQFTGANPIDKWAGPLPIGLIRPMEIAPVFAVLYPHVITWSSDYDWVFAVENNVAASALRKVLWMRYNKNTGQYDAWGWVTLTLNNATAHTQRGFRMTYDKYSVGTASCAGGTAVTGTSTLWVTNRQCVGCRIGFGSQDPTQITAWYYISAIAGETSITLTGNGPNTGGTVNYVIEDLRAYVVTTNATTTNGGLFCAKGLNIDDFTPAGTTIVAGGTTDNLKAVYWLADAATVTNTISWGLCVDAKVDWQTQDAYIIDIITSPNTRVFKYNVRAALAGLSSGKSTSAWVLTTGGQAITGTASQVNNGRLGTLGHGPGNGVKSIYFVTTTRIYRAAVTNVTSGNVNWQSDAMTEVPPGGVGTFPATGGLNNLEVADTIDRLIVFSSGAAGVRSYVTQYNVVGNPMDHIFLIDSKQINQSAADSGLTPFPSINVSNITAWSEGGVCHMCRSGTTAILNQIFAVPLGADWIYASTVPIQRLITPAIPTLNAKKFIRAYVNEVEFLGSNILGLSTEPFRISWRTAGIVDNSGSWTSLGSDMDLGSIAGADAIQFMFEFRVIGITCIPARILSVAVLYEDELDTDSHYEPDVSKSNVADRIFAYRQCTAWGTNIPKLRIRLYNAVTGVLQLDDDTTLQAYGVFEYSINGTTWLAWDDTQEAVGYFVRYTADSLADGIIVRSLLTQAG